MRISDWSSDVCSSDLSGGLQGALVSIDAITCNATIATAIAAAGADYLLAVKVNQPTLRAEIEAFFADAPAETLDTVTDHDKAHGRIEERSVTVSRETALRQAQGDHRHAPLPRRTAPPRCRHPRARHP